MVLNRAAVIGISGPLDLPDCKGGPYRLQAIHRTDTPPGPAGRFLIAHFEQQAENDDMTYSDRW